MASVGALASYLYSTYVLDLVIVACFLALRLMRFAPRKIAKPLVDWWSSISHAQPAS
jgi:type III secretory pathway component EscR